MGALRETPTRRKYWWLLLLLLGLGAVLLGLLPHPRSDDLADLTLTGMRGPACVRIVVAPDVSGSMTQFEQVRTTALAEVARWAPANLRDDDEFAVIVWDDGATVALAPIPLSAGANLPTSLGQPGSGGSDIGPAVDLLPALPTTPCRSAIVAISDGIIGTDTSGIEETLRASGFDRVAIILPNGSSAPATWMDVFPYSLQFHADPQSTAQTGRAVAEAIAATTDQLLVER
ncbi:vWA domain-containing protein [Microbacterium sp. HA-8]|uniref:vWA domain-containing protein n=1 Tax=Microbacterium sp. HA-8 TaxID=3234200 RepID=UPI0038F6EB50